MLPSFRNLVVDRKRMGPSHWLSSVLSVPFNALIPKIGTGRSSDLYKKNPVPHIPKGFFLEQVGKENHAGAS